MSDLAKEMMDAADRPFVPAHARRLLREGAARLRMEETDRESLGRSVAVLRESVEAHAVHVERLHGLARWLLFSTDWDVFAGRGRVWLNQSWVMVPDEYLALARNLTEPAVGEPDEPRPD